jgi:hypothetical protein
MILVFYLPLVAVLGVFAGIAWNAIRKQSWARAYATITKAVPTQLPKSSSDSWVIAVDYQYEVDEKEYDGFGESEKRVFKTRAAAEVYSKEVVGQVTVVAYDPKLPRVHQLEPSDNIQNYQILLAVCLLIFLGLTFASSVELFRMLLPVLSAR